MGGCSWVIELDVTDQFGNKYLELLNLKNFNVTLVDGQRVKFTFIEKNDGYTPCMLGTRAELTVIFDE